MTKKILLFLAVFLVCAINAHTELRSFDTIFPDISPSIRASVFNDSGYIRTSEKAQGFTIIGNARSAAINPQIINAVMNRKPGYIVESISIIPGKPGSLSLLEVYNALGNIRGLKGKLYPSATRNKEVPLFEEATRILSEKQTTAIPDPAPARVVPKTETVYLRLKDVNFGNSYYRGDVTLVQNGLQYSLSNYKNITYFMIPVIKEGNFIAQLYFEPIEEGLLIYSIAGADVSDFLASKIDMGSAISKRLSVIISWAADGINRAKK